MTKQTGAPKRSDTALRGGIWTTLARIATQLIHFAIFMVAVRVMTPEEFGIFALAAAFAVLLTQFASAGWPEYIMQWGGDETRPRETLFVAMASGLFFAGLGSVLSLFAPLFSGDAIAGQLVRVLSACIFFTSAASAVAGLMNWQNRLTAAAMASLAGELVNFAVSVWALLAGHGVLALAYGRLAGAVCWCAAGFSAARLPPAVIRQPELIQEMLRFSASILSIRLLGILRVYAATFVLGGFMGAAAVGYYRAAQRIIGAFEEIVSEPARLLAWSAFRKCRDAEGGPQGFGALANEFYAILLYCAVPLFAGVALMARDLAYGILGPDWGLAVPVVRILAVAAVIKASGHITLPVLSLAGQVRIMPYIVSLYVVIAIGFISTAAPYGIAATAWAEAAASAVIFAINIWVLRRYANIRWSRIAARAWPLVPALAAALLPPVLVDRIGLLSAVPELLRFVLLGLAMVAVFIPAVLAFDRPLRRRLALLMRN